jgi:HSP20 family protein
MENERAKGTTQTVESQDTNGHPPRSPRYSPAIDVTEDADRFRISADMPGCNPQEIDVRYDQGVLTILGKIHPRTDRAGGALSLEYRVGDYFRTFNLGESIHVEGIEASYENGVLTLILPKVEAAKPKKIEVRTK